MSKQTLIRTFDFLAEPTARTNSFVGTEEYLAPEIIIGACWLVPGRAGSAGVPAAWCLVCSWSGGGACGPSARVAALRLLCVHACQHDPCMTLALQTWDQGHMCLAKGCWSR